MEDDTSKNSFSLNYLGQLRVSHSLRCLEKRGEPIDSVASIHFVANAKSHILSIRYFNGAIFWYEVTLDL